MSNSKLILSSNKRKSHTSFIFCFDCVKPANNFLSCFSLQNGIRICCILNVIGIGSTFILFGLLFHKVSKVYIIETVVSIIILTLLFVTSFTLNNKCAQIGYILRCFFDIISFILMIFNTALFLFLRIFSKDHENTERDYYLLAMMIAMFLIKIVVGGYFLYIYFSFTKHIEIGNLSKIGQKSSRKTDLTENITASSI